MAKDKLKTQTDKQRDRKNRNVEKSTHGKFKTVAAFDKYRQDVTGTNESKTAQRKKTRRK